jgi:hypothetical protein
MHSVAHWARLRALHSGQSVLDQTLLESVPILGRSIMLEWKSTLTKHTAGQVFSPKSLRFLISCLPMIHQVILKWPLDLLHGQHLPSIGTWWSHHCVNVIGMKPKACVCKLTQTATSLYTSTAPPPTRPLTTSSLISIGIHDTSTDQSTTTNTTTLVPYSKPSQTRIASAVVGPVVGMAIIVWLLWLLYSRRKRKQNSLTNQALIPGQYTHEQADYVKHQLSYEDPRQGTYSYQPEVHGMHANHLSQDPLELPASEHRRPRWFPCIRKF